MPNALFEPKGVTEHGMGHVMRVLQECVGYCMRHVLAMLWSWALYGYIMAMLRTCYWQVLVTFWVYDILCTCIGHVLGICMRNKEGSNTAAGQTGGDTPWYSNAPLRGAQRGQFLIRRVAELRLTAPGMPIFTMDIDMCVCINSYLH